MKSVKIEAENNFSSALSISKCADVIIYYFVIIHIPPID